MIMDFLSAYLLLFLFVILGAFIGTQVRKVKTKVNELKRDNPRLGKTHSDEVLLRYIQIHKKRKPNK